RHSADEEWKNRGAGGARRRARPSDQESGSAGEPGGAGPVRAPRRASDVNVRIKQTTFDQIIAHALAERPNECCGLLIGTEDLVDDAVPARNVHRSPTKFKVEPADHFAAIRRARAAGRQLIGAYHSHPNGPSGPSELDRVRLSDPT